MTSDARSVANQFYDAFARMDGATMANLYDATATFSDEVFGSLSGAEAGAMWKMFTSSRSSNLKITYEVISATAFTADVIWHASYKYSEKLRDVNNVVMAHLTIQNGKITSHRDQFSFWKWSRQALGPIGALLGWSPFLKNKVRAKARSKLSQFMSQGH